MHLINTHFPKLLAALVVLLSAAGCGPGNKTHASSMHTDSHSSSPSAASENAVADKELAALPVAKRLAFMTGHVEAGLALYRAGEPGMAARHLLHPVAETHAAEREGLDALGFDASLFIAVSDALDSGVPAADIEPQLRAAQQNLAAVAAQAGGDPVEIIDFLLDTIAEEYAVGVRDGVVTDMGEYQDAFGFTIVAIDRAAALDDSTSAAVIAQLEQLLAMWPDAPIPPTTASSVAAIDAQVQAVRAAMKG